MTFFENKPKRFFFSLVAIIAVVLLTGCSQDTDDNNSTGGASPAPVTPVNSLVYEGQDIKSNFLAEYSGAEYQLANHQGRVDGLFNGNERLSLNRDGTYALAISGLEIRKADDTRSARCDVIERGNITHVQKIENRDTEVRMGVDTVRTAKPIDTVLVLDPVSTQILKSDTFIAGDGAQAAPLSIAEVESLCTRTTPRNLAIEARLYEAFVLAPKADAQPGGLFLNERLAHRTGEEWAWVTGDVAKQAVRDTTPILEKGVDGLEVEGSAVNILQGAENPNNVVANVRINDVTNHITLEVGNSVMGAFSPVMQISGHFEGVSFSPKTGEVIYNIANYQVTPVKVKVEAEERGFMSGALGSVRDFFSFRDDVSSSISRLEAQEGRILSVGVSSRENDSLKIRTKSREQAVSRVPPLEF